MQLRKNQTILFQGDSITDCGRNRQDPKSLGGGYAMMTAAWLSAQYAPYHLTFLNRGNSGNRAADLVSRWDADCIALRPDWVSIMIGINDTWRRYDSGAATTAAAFEAAYRAILARTASELKARIVMCEPFVLPHPPDRVAWREDLDPKLDAVRRLAKEFDAVLVPLDRIFADACRRQPPPYWAGDGVHPTLAGHALIAQSWIRYAVEV